MTVCFRKLWETEFVLAAEVQPAYPPPLRQTNEVAFNNHNVSFAKLASGRKTPIRTL